jgi:hypothetical protein
MADLSAYPIVRLDQIPLVDSETLVKAIDDVRLMLEKDGNVGGMAKYLKKQLYSMELEASNRKAASRVEQLLSGKIDSTAISYSPPPSPHKRDVPKKSSQLEEKPNITTAIKTNDSKETVFPSTQVSFQSNRMMPLDSKSSSKSTKETSATSSLNETTSVRQSLTASTLKAESEKSYSEPQRNSSVPNLNFQPLTTSLTSDKGGNHQTDILSTISNSTPRSMTSSRTTRSRHSNPSSNQNSEEGPSKKSLDIVYQNFGNEFIVAATEKKVRFFKKKVTTESYEERKKREQLER